MTGADATGLPVWFLDVDGVVNASPAPSRRWMPQFTHRVVSVELDGRTEELPLWWRPAVVDFINEASRSGQVRVCWLTTWGQSAREVFGPAVGLDELPVVGEQPDGAGAYPDDDLWWKVAEIRGLVPDDGRVIFTDDDLNSRSRAQLRDTYDSPLLLTPMSSPGLTDEHLNQITRYLKDRS